MRASSCVWVLRDDTAAYWTIDNRLWKKLLKPLGTTG